MNDSAIYVNALLENQELAEQVIRYDAFSDISCSPGKKPFGEILVENDQDFVLLKLEKCNRASSDKEICVWPPYGKTFIHMIKCVYKKAEKRQYFISE